jgi:hypothetical protein
MVLKYNIFSADFTMPVFIRNISGSFLKKAEAGKKQNIDSVLCPPRRRRGGQRTIFFAVR